MHPHRQERPRETAPKRSATGFRAPRTWPWRGEHASRPERAGEGRTSTLGHPEAGGQDGSQATRSWQETLPASCDTHRSATPTVAGSTKRAAAHHSATKKLRSTPAFRPVAKQRSGRGPEPSRPVPLSGAGPRWAPPANRFRGPSLPGRAGYRREGGPTRSPASVGGTSPPRDQGVFGRLRAHSRPGVSAPRNHNAGRRFGASGAGTLSPWEGLRPPPRRRRTCAPRGSAGGEPLSCSQPPTPRPRRCHCPRGSERQKQSPGPRGGGARSW